VNPAVPAAEAPQPGRLGADARWQPLRMRPGPPAGESSPE